MEVTVAEANTLEGVEECLEEEGSALMGLRGVRRHMRYPASLDAELNVLRAVYEHHPQLLVVAPFVSAVHEYEWFRDKVHDVVGLQCRVGCMVETPAAVLDSAKLAAAGADYLLVGTNDLSSLLSARPRSRARTTDLVDGMRAALDLVRRSATAHAADMHVAGDLTPALVDAAFAAGADTCVVHYADLPKHFGPGYNDLPGLSHLQAVKATTRAAIAVQRKRANPGRGVT